MADVAHDEECWRIHHECAIRQIEHLTGRLANIEEQMKVVWHYQESVEAMIKELGFLGGQTGPPTRPRRLRGLP